MIFSSPWLILKRHKDKSSFSSLTFIIPKRIGTAPYRNYIRRCCKEILRKDNFMIPGSNWIIIAKSTKDKKKYADIKLIFDQVKGSVRL